MFAADQMGWERVVQLMESIASLSGPSFAVTPRIRALAADHSRIHAAV
jgi:hypothetical protein